MTFTLGRTPQSMTVQLANDSDFDTVIVNTEGDWGVDETLELRFSDGTTWTATTALDEATFHEDKADVNTLIAAAPAYVTLFFVSPAGEAQWANGGVTINA